MASAKMVIVRDPERSDLLVVSTESAGYCHLQASMGWMTHRTIAVDLPRSLGKGAAPRRTFSVFRGH